MQKKKKKIQIKSTKADMCLKYLKKELFIYLCAFLKHLRERKPSYKNIWVKAPYYILSQLSLCIFKGIKIFRVKVTHYIMSQLSICIFFKRIKNIWTKSRMFFMLLDVISG